MVWDDVFPIVKGTMECNCCGHLGKLKEFEAKRYSCYVQIIVSVIAFNEEDAKKEFDFILEDNDDVDLESCFDKLIKIEED